MGRLERIQTRFEGAIARACRKYDARVRVAMGDAAVEVCGAFSGVDVGGENVAVGSVGDRARFFFAREEWARVQELVGSSLDFTVSICGTDWTPDFGAPAVVDPVSGVVVLSVCRAVVTR